MRRSQPEGPSNSLREPTEMEAESASRKFSYRSIQVFTLLAGGALWYILRLFACTESDWSELGWALIQSLKFLSGLGMAVALLSWVLPAVGRPILRGYYIFFFALYCAAITFLIPRHFMDSPVDAFAVLPVHIFIFAVLAGLLKILAPPTEKKKETLSEV